MADQSQAIAAEFWGRAGVTGHFPRDIESAVLWSLPLGVVKVPRLGTDAVRAWLAKSSLQDLIPAGARKLRACIIAARGQGLVFIDGADPEPEQRYSLAHETSHFLMDYFLPRRRAVEILGEKIISVLDGDRAPTDQERFSAVLGGVRLGVYSRLWDRGPRGVADDLEAVGREDAADALALELLAPRAEVTRAARGLAWDHAAVGDLLVTRFALPPAAAAAYASQVCVSGKPPSTFREWLGVKNP